MLEQTVKLKLDERTLRLLRFLPRGDAYHWLELLLLTVLAVQCARLVWTVFTPVDPLGAWQPRQAAIGSLASRTALFGSFDPFFRTPVTAATATPQVTSLDLKLFGVRVNQGTGGGSAIIAGPDGIQNSIVEGQAILPGVTLREVHFDHVVIDRSGAQEMLYLDQSMGPPPVALAPGGTTMSVQPAPASQTIAPPPPPPPAMQTAPTSAQPTVAQPPAAQPPAAPSAGAPEE